MLLSSVLLISVNKNVEIKLFDVAGRLITSKTTRLKDVYIDFPTQGLAKGVYILSIKVGSNDPFTKKIFGGE